jgi:hypothetical protein
MRSMFVQSRKTSFTPADENALLRAYSQIL